MAHSLVNHGMNPMGLQVSVPSFAPSFMQTRVLVFGTFDNLDTGHLFFLESAKSLGNTLVVSVARDVHVRDLKRRESHQNEQTRLQNVLLIPEVDEAVLSDEVLGSFESLQTIKPDVIALGYDQDELADALKKWLKANKIEVRIVRLDKQEAVRERCMNCSCGY